MSDTPKFCPFCGHDPCERSHYSCPHPTPPSAGAKTISQLRDEEMGDDYEFAPVSPKGLETMRYGPTREHLRAVRIAAENERRGEVPNGLRRTLENCLTDAFQAGVTASNAQVAERVRQAREEERKDHATHVNNTAVGVADEVRRQYAPLVALVREWQEARKVWKEARRTQEQEPVVEWKMYLTAESALASYPVEGK